MALPGRRTIATARVGLPGVLLAVTVEMFGLTTTLPWAVALVVGGAGIAAAIAVRTRSAGRRTDTAALLVLLVLGVLALTAPDTPLTGIAAGLVVLAFLLWLADEPGRVSGGARRALPAVGVTALAFGIAWVGAFLLPAARVPIGVVGGLLVAVILLAALLLGRPEQLEQEPALTAP
ncbi:MAG: hypothetical protein ACLQD8_05295 [Thermoplasmata archaeon]